MRIPTYDRQTVQESGQGREYIRPAQQNYVGAEGQALQQLGGSLQQNSALAMRFAEQRQKEQDSAAAYDALYKMNSWSAEALHGDSGLYRLTGANADGVADKYGKLHKEQFDKLTDGMSVGGTNIFKRLASRSFSAEVGQLGRFEADERQKFLKDAASSAATSSVNNYVTSGGDPEFGKIAEEDIDAALAISMAGADAQTVANKKLEILSGMHSQVLDGLIDQSVEGGRAYLEKFKDQMTGAEINVAKKKLDKANDIQEVQGYVNSLSLDEMTQTEALAQMREKLPLDQQQDAAREIKTRYTEMKNADDELRQQNFDDVLGVINDGGTPSASQWASLKESDEATLRKAWADARTGNTVKTDFAVWNSITQMPENDFRKLNLNQYVNQISTNDLQALRKDQKELLNGKPFSATTIMAPSTAARTWLKKQKIDAESEKGLEFIRQAQVEVTALEEQSGKKAEPEQIIKIYDRLMREVEVYGTLWNSDVPYYQVQDTDKLIIPNDEKSKIEAALKRRNIPVTEDALQIYYRAKLNK